MKAEKVEQSKILLAGILPVTGVTAVYLIPLCWTVLYAFSEDSYLSRFVGFKNIEKMINSSLFQLGLQNLLFLGITMILLATSVTILLAIILRYIRASELVLSVLLIPLFLPSVSVSSFWKALFHIDIFLSDGVARLALGTLFTWKYIGFCTIPVLITLKRIPEEVCDAARMDGAGNWRLLYHIQIPLILRAVVLSAAIQAVFYLRIYKEAYLLFGEYPTNGVYLVQHYLVHQYQKLNYQHVSAAALLLMGICLVAFCCIQRIISKRGEWL